MEETIPIKDFQFKVNFKENSAHFEGNGFLAEGTLHLLNNGGFTMTYATPPIRTEEVSNAIHLLSQEIFRRLKS